MKIYYLVAAWFLFNGIIQWVEGDYLGSNINAALALGFFLLVQVNTLLDRVWKLEQVLKAERGIHDDSPR